MSQKVKVILNPVAGYGPTKEKVPQLDQALQQTGAEYSLVATDYPKHATELAHEATLDGWPIIAAAGGDGTINEVVNGILKADTHQPKLGIIPMGMANDLATVLNIPSDVAAACHRLTHGTAQPIDVGEVNQHYFVNSSAIGLQPMVTINQQKWPSFGGGTRYLMAAIQSILFAQSWDMRIDWPNGAYEGQVLLVSVGNTARTGGMVQMTPQANPTDGLLDFMYGTRMHRWQMFRLLPKTLQGSHTEDLKVTYKQTKQLTIEAHPATAIQADGEIIDTGATQIVYNILPARLEIVI